MTTVETKKVGEKMRVNPALIDSPMWDAALADIKSKFLDAATEFGTPIETTLEWEMGDPDPTQYDGLSDYSWLHLSVRVIP